jgi:hypothetical protein
MLRLENRLLTHFYLCLQGLSKGNHRTNPGKGSLFCVKVPNDFFAVASLSTLPRFAVGLSLGVEILGFRSEGQKAKGSG